MRLAFCIFNYFPFGGCQRDFLKIALECQQRGHDIHVFTMAWQGDIPAGFNVELISVKGVTNHGRCLSFSDLAQKHLSADAFDAVIGFSKMAGLDVYFAADPCFAQKATEKYGSLATMLPRNRFFMQLEKAVFNDSEGANHILTLTDRDIAAYRSVYNTPRERFHLLPPGLPGVHTQMLVSASERKQIRSSFNVKDSELLLLMVGSGFKTKGVDRTIRALAKLPQQLRERVRLKVAGKGNPRSFMRLAHSVGVDGQVEFLGERDDVSTLMRSADGLLHPSRTELAGMVLLEAMCAGCPVLVTENCGYAQHISAARCGIIVPDPFKQETMNRFLQIFLESDERDTWSNNGLAYVQGIDISSLPQKAADIIELSAENREGHAVY